MNTFLKLCFAGSIGVISGFVSNFAFSIPFGFPAGLLFSLSIILVLKISEREKISFSKGFVFVLLSSLLSFLAVALTFINYNISGTDTFKDIAPFVFMSGAFGGIGMLYLFSKLYHLKMNINTFIFSLLWGGGLGLLGFYLLEFLFIIWQGGMSLFLMKVYLDTKETV